MLQLSHDLVVLPLPKVAIDLWNAQQRLAKHYAHTGLKFTLDGRLIGDIAEALALEHFGLELLDKRTNGVDLRTKSNDTVQVKATGLENSGPSFSRGSGRADYLLFFQLNFSAGSATVIYNGPEQPVRAELLPESWTGTKGVRLSKLRDLAQKLRDSRSLPLKKQG